MVNFIEAIEPSSNQSFCFNLRDKIKLSTQTLCPFIKTLESCRGHPRRPRGSQSSREKRRDESFQAQAEEPLGTDSHWTISKRSSECWLLIGHKKCFVLLCPIGEQHLLSSIREFVHDATAIDSITACLAHKTNARSQETFSLI